MFIRTLDQCIEEGRRVMSETGTWDSTRMLLKNDNMGFTFNITNIYPNSETHIWYKHHLEAVYCLSGSGEVETLADGKIYTITPGTLYNLDKHDEHLLRGGPDGMQVACVFNPPLTGREVHDKDGAYRLDEEVSGD